MSSRKFIGELDADPQRKVVKQELDAVSTVATAAAAAAAVKVDWNAAAGAANEILNKPDVPALNNTLNSTSTTEAATANAVKLLNDKIDGKIKDNKQIDTIANFNLLTGLSTDLADYPLVYHVDDDGDGKWAKYEILSTPDGTVANGVVVKINDEDALNAGLGATNLGYTEALSGGTVTNNTGADAVIPDASDTRAGLLSAAKHAEIGDRGKAFAIPGDNTTTTFPINIGYTDDVVGLNLWEVASQEYVDIKIVRAKNSAIVTVGPFATAPLNATTYELHALRG